MPKEKKIQAPPATDYLRGQREAAQYARVSTRTISDWQSRKVIPFIKPARKLVLFRKTDIDAALSKFTVAAI